jgi:hypothetical protein
MLPAGGRGPHRGLAKGVATLTNHGSPRLPSLSCDHTENVSRQPLRGRIAIILVLLFVAEIAFLTAFFWFNHDKADAGRFSDLKDFMGLILTPTVALVGAATGFYFGGRASGG